MAFLGGFSNIAVYRLKHTREGSLHYTILPRLGIHISILDIPQAEQNMWIEMRSLMDSEGGFANFRARLEKTVNPCIPYMYVCSTWCTTLYLSL